MISVNNTWDEMEIELKMAQKIVFIVFSKPYCVLAVLTANTWKKYFGAVT